MSDDEVTKSAEDLAKVEPSQHDVEEDQGAVIPVIVSEDNANSEEKVVPELKVEPQKVNPESKDHPQVGFGMDYRRVKDHDIFVGNLSLYTSNERLRTFLEEYGGKVEDVRIMFHPGTNRSRRYGFVTFVDTRTVEVVLKKELVLDGKKLDIRSAFKRIEEELGIQQIKTDFKSEPRPVKVFVGGISQDTTEAELREYFSRYGKLTDCNLMADGSKPGRHRGFAFVTFEFPTSADTACESKSHFIGQKMVDVKRATPRPFKPKKSWFCSKEVSGSSNLRREMSSNSTSTSSTTPSANFTYRPTSIPALNQESCWNTYPRTHAQSYIFPELGLNYPPPFQVDFSVRDTNSNCGGKIGSFSGASLRYSPYALPAPVQQTPTPLTPALVYPQPALYDPMYNLQALMGTTYQNLWPTPQQPATYPQFAYPDFQHLAASSSMTPRYMYLNPPPTFLPSAQPKEESDYK